MDNKNQNDLKGRKLSELSSHPENDPNELIEFRFLCREGMLCIIGQTGIGKSSFSMQAKISLALGRKAFGLTPKQPLKSLLIQAENDDGDIAEMRDGVIKGLKLTPEDAKQAGDNIIVINESQKTGKEFIKSVVEPALEMHQPDLLWIDPALAFLGGDTNSQEDVGGFLRNHLNPLLKKYKCACIIIHHTNKNSGSENAYSGSGSAEWGNAVRASLILTKKGGGCFELKAGKRASRLRWKMSDGKTPTDSIFLKHSNVEGQIFWVEVDEDEIKKAMPLIDQESDEEIILKNSYEQLYMEKSLFITFINKKTGMGIGRLREAVAKMIQNKKLFEHEEPRNNARPAKYISIKPEKGPIKL